MAERPTVIVTRRWPAACEQRLGELFAFQLRKEDRPMMREELVEALSECDALFCTVTDRITRAVIEAADPLRARLIGNFGVGYNNIDIEAAKARELVVTNTPGVLDDCTADLAMTLLLMVARRAGAGERQLRAGLWTGWRPTHLLGTQVTGKALGIVGLGRIGRAMARRAAGFGMRVLFYDPAPPPAEELAALGAEARGSLRALLSESDFVSLHCPATPETRHLIGAPELAAMRPHAMLINTSRGDVIDEAELAQALQLGVIAGAGLDVFEDEPAVHEGLLEREDVVLLPHLGSATLETRVAMGMRVIDNAVAFFAGEPPPHRVA